jgi:ABC-type transporter Mla subunit MlaD
MAMATGGDVVLQMLRELRDLQQQVQVDHERTEERLTGTQRNVGTLTQTVGTLTRNVATMGQTVGTLTQTVETLTQNVATLTQNVATLTRNVATMGQNVEMLAENMSGLVESFRGTKQLHEQYLTQLGHTVSVLADQQLLDREKLGPHERRIGALEQA